MTCNDDYGTLSGKLSMAPPVIRDHKVLSGRDLPDQHPISAITGLEEVLLGTPLPEIIGALIEANLLMAVGDYDGTVLADNGQVLIW